MGFIAGAIWMLSARLVCNTGMKGVLAKLVQTLIFGTIIILTVGN